MSRRAHGPLFWRVYLHGVLLLLVVAIAVGAVGFALRRGSGWWSERGAGRYAAERVGELVGDPPRLSAELARVREAFGVEASVYAPGGGLVATSARDPAAAARPDARRRGWTVPLRDGGTLVVHSRPHDPARGLLFIGAVLAALAVASYPLTRAIVAPVERLTAAARALGAGDLAARANVRAHGELGELGRSFDEMAARLEALVRGERELLANVSHELRTPLARIRVALELAAEGDAARARRYLGEIGQDLAELDALVQDVLDAARLEARGAAALRLDAGPLELADVARAAASRFHGGHEGRALELEVGPGTRVHGDAALLRRMLDNLLDNAAKYSEAPSPVRLSVRAEPGAAILEVSDRGIGIAPEDLPRLFTPFFRTDRSRERGTGGTGLGLVLARRVAEAHGGSISVESAPGQGSTFRVRIPSAPA
ncbi:histidine kinase [Anaeromyxobacter dehalogenans 2CP-1]|uniref:Signal transduction histidine-protein kinase/phosphatase MprB n=1 Tax=Anaeromyxobacter dehalogenans (strain ATCC BAA-258 / DSM 21875 / 2CP-1) TaxID=455488 RepID=B8JG39_ANAD2|nr:HAMP domain-containing sensor histidine kinase [Anaeromyxobacter dehalogenans]ACL66442.1 histidine kinase [Anaeromyxobacter dehalogenans 2CP-1]